MTNRQTETARIKATCQAHGYKVTVQHGHGTAYGWLTVTLHNPIGRHDCADYGQPDEPGRGCSPDCPACACRKVWSWDVQELTYEVTGRDTEYAQYKVIVNAPWQSDPETL